MNYLNFQDYNNPIKPVLDSRYLFTLVPDFQKNTYISIKKSKVELIDSFFQLGQSEEKTFYSVGKTNTDLIVIGSASNTLLTLRFVQDPSLEEYERRVYSIFDVTGKLGGVYEILFIIGAFLTRKFNSKTYLYSVFS